MAFNLNGFPKPFQKLPEPIRSLVGKYEAALLRQGSTRQTFDWMADALEGFFYDHPTVKRPEQILITDIEDWKEARLAKGQALSVVRRDMCALSGFYSFLSSEGYLTKAGGELENPVVIPPWRPSMRVRAPQNRVLSLHPDLRQVDADE